jgi:prepilin-type N-terminal cleavage/methylation domain-containing protein
MSAFANCKSRLIVPIGRVPPITLTIRGSSTSGFTFVELLLVIAIIGVLVTLLLPAVQLARESARRASCFNNLGQIILAVHHYEMVHDRYPSGTLNSTGPIVNSPAGYHLNWIVQVLPYIEQQNAYNLLDKKASVYSQQNAAIANNIPSFLVCPSTGRSAAVPAYAGCHHDQEKPIDAADNGVFFLNSFVRHDDVTDGSSYTILVGEKLPDAWDLHWLSGTRATLRSTGVPINWLNYNNGLPKPSDSEPPPPLTRVPFIYNGGDAFEDPASEAPNQPGVGPTISSTTTLQFPPGNPSFVGGFGSVHSGGAQFGMGDGSIRFIPNNINSETLQLLANRSDGVPVGDY